MDSLLLTTKVRVPAPTLRGVVRHQLLDMLEHEVPAHNLTLVICPPGYGKTTLLAQWAATTGIDVAWVALDDGDNDALHFLRYLLKAWELVDPDIRQSPLGKLLGGLMPDLGAVLAAFINAGSDHARHLAFVLDDYHVIENPDVHQVVAYLLDHLPDTLHVVIATRSEPLLPVARYRARRELAEITHRHLMFERSEAQAFLTGVMHLDLAPEVTAALVARTDGWITGLQLAGLAIQRHSDTLPPPAFSGRHRYVADYFREEVLAHMPDELRQFLLQTSILDRLFGVLCDAVTNRDDSQDTLERLEREHLFTFALDAERIWFQYHPLFTGFLREELLRGRPEDVHDLHRRAALWYLERESAVLSFHHAVAADDIAVTLEVMERHHFLLLSSGEFRTIANWYEALPSNWLMTHPMIQLFHAGYLAFTGALAESTAALDAIQARIGSHRQSQEWGRLVAFRCLIACMGNDLDQAEHFGTEALAILPPGDLLVRSGIHHSLGDTYRQHGQWDQARDHYLQVIAHPQESTFPVRAAHIHGALADLELRQGHIRSAAGWWTKALQAITPPDAWGRVALPTIGWVHIRFGEVLYEWNDLAQAAAHAATGLEYAELGGDPQALIAGHVLAAKIALAVNELETAESHTKQAGAMLETATFPEWSNRLERLQVDLWLAQDRLRAITDWSDGFPTGSPDNEPEHEVVDLALARVFVLAGVEDSRSRANALLDKLVATSHAEGRIAIELEAKAIRAMSLASEGHEVEAMIALEGALRLAEPEGYIRTLVDLGSPMAQLVQRAASRDVMPGYTALLLSAWNQPDVTAVSTSHVLPSPLTPREQEVLNLIAAGLTNREIAGGLFISAETLRKHTGNILGKLGVHTRTGAVARARELGLVD